MRKYCQLCLLAKRIHTRHSPSAADEQQACKQPELVSRAADCCTCIETCLSISLPASHLQSWLQLAAEGLSSKGPGYTAVYQPPR